MRTVLATLLLLAPIGAGAAPILYAHTGGSASIELRLNGNVVASASAPLDGMSLTFDAATASITALDILLIHQVAFPRLLGYDTLAFSLQATGAPGYTSSGSGTNPYSVVSGPLLISFAGTILDGLNRNFSGSLTTGSVPVTVTLAGPDLSAAFSSTRMIQHGWQSLELLVAVTFEGTALPEPSTEMLPGAAMFLACAVKARRRGPDSRIGV